MDETLDGDMSWGALLGSVVATMDEDDDGDDDGGDDGRLFLFMLSCMCEWSLDGHL